MLGLSAIGLGAYALFSSKPKVEDNIHLQWSTLRADALTVSNDDLAVIFSNMSVGDLGRCAKVCSQWNKVITGGEYDNTIWNKVVRRQRWGKEVWEEKVGKVGDEPEYPNIPFNGMEGEKIPWRGVCKMQRRPSWYRKNGRMLRMPEFDFLVPATIHGKPSTIRLLLRVLPDLLIPGSQGREWERILQRYGDIPVNESYWVRHTWTVIEGTQGDVQAREAQIQAKGKGNYRAHKMIELMMFQFLCFQMGIWSGYEDGDSVVCTETRLSHGHEFPWVVSPHCKRLWPVVNHWGFLCWSYKDEKLYGTGAVRELK